MLVLSREVGERIMIGNDVQITIIRVAGGRVAIGIDAPTHVIVRRSELSRQLETPPRVDALPRLDGPFDPASIMSKT